MTELGSAAGANPGTTADIGLKRAIGPTLLLLFIVGDLLGTGIYTLTGEVASYVGGMVWLPFLLAVAVALLTALSYLELVTKYPRAAGAALYVHKAFGSQAFTFVVGFAVMCSGITSASTASRAFAANLADAFDLTMLEGVGITLVGLAFMLVIAVINYRGVGESLKANVLFTLVELTGLLIVIAIGVWVLGTGGGESARVLEFGTAGTDGMVWPAITATTLAFFAMIGFEDSVNMVEECRNPSRIFPRVLLSALAVTALIYVLVAVAAISVVPPERLAEGDTPLLTVVATGAPGFPLWLFGLITMFAVANTALLNMLMASRLLYGMSREGVLPVGLGKVHPRRRTPYAAIAFTTALALALIIFVGEIPALAGTTTLLLMGVFVAVNIAVLVLRRDRVEHRHFRTATPLAVLGALSCAFLVGPWSGREPVQYLVAAVLIAIGLGLWLVNRALTRRGGGRR